MGSSAGFVNGSTHSLSYTFLLFIFKMNTSCASVWVISPNSHLAARPFKVCQNCCRDSFGNCLRDKKWCLSNVLFRAIWKQPSQLCSISVACRDQIVFSGCLSRKIFRPASPNDRNIMLTAFLFAASSGLSPRSLYLRICLIRCSGQFVHRDGILCHHCYSKEVNPFLPFH